MREHLTPGQTVIGTNLARTKNGEKIEVKIIYVDEERGLLENSDFKRVPIDGEQYKKKLAEYRQKCEEDEKRAARRDDVDSFMQDGNREYISRDSGQPTDYTLEENGSYIGDGGGSGTPPRKPGKARHDEAAKLKKKDVKVPLIILIVVFAIAALLFIAANFMGINVFGNSKGTSQSEEVTAATEPEGEVTTYDGGQDVQAVDVQESYIVTVVSRDVPLGDVLTEDMVEQRQVTAEEYAEAGATEYVSSDGTVRTGTPVGWSSVKSYMGMILNRSLKEGDVLMREDLTGDVRTITGKTEITLYAVITSDNMEDEITLNLGKYVVEAGTLDDILNSKGFSIKDSAGDETTGENK